ncbi:MAG: hypothetical protein GX130_02025 [Candidatus Hydrogenedens sp.]|nr:hypothetical protein [Candidatus Hydrogenedens sp.]
MTLLRTLMMFSLTAILLTGCHIVSASDWDTKGENIPLTPLEDGTGYSLYSSVYGLQGTLTKKPDSKEPWKLEGKISLPSSGYNLKEPEILVAESYPEQVSITLTVVPPPRGTIVLPAFFWYSFEAEIQASAEAQFSVKLISNVRRPSQGDDKKTGRRHYPPGYTPGVPSHPYPPGKPPRAPRQPRLPGERHPDLIPLLPPDNAAQAPDNSESMETPPADSTP